jgi:diacylglycerol kinase (ATP)
MIRCQHNAWIQLVVTVAVVGAGLFFQLSPGEWRWIVLAIAIVWTAEALNTAFEFLATLRRQAFIRLCAMRKMLPLELYLSPQSQP